MKRILLFGLCSIGLIGGACNWSKSSPVSETPPSPSVSSPKWGAWSPVPGFEGGEITSFAWKGDDLYVLNDSGVFLWKGDEAGFEILPGNEALHNFGLDVNPSAEASPFLSSLVHHPPSDSLFVLANFSLLRRTGSEWIDTGKDASSLLEADGTLYLRNRGVVSSSSDGSSWKLLPPLTIESSQDACCFGPLSFDSFNQRLFTFNGTGIFFFDLTNGNWEQMPQGDDFTSGPLSVPNVVAIDPVSGDVYAGTAWDVYVSKEGVGWSPPLLAQQFGELKTYGVQSIAFDPAADRAYLASELGVLRRTGEGPWEPLPGIEETVSEIHFHDGRLWAPSKTGFWSYDEVLGWDKHPLKGVSTKRILALKMVGGVLYAETDEVIPFTDTDDIGNGGHAVYRMEGEGSWQLVPFGLEYDVYRSASSSSSSFSYLAGNEFAKISIPSLNLHFVAAPEGIFFSEDAKAWRIWTEGLPTYRVTSFAYDDAAGILYAGTIGHGVWKLALR